MSRIVCESACRTSLYDQFQREACYKRCEDEPLPSEMSGNLGGLGGFWEHILEPRDPTDPSIPPPVLPTAPAPSAPAGPALTYPMFDAAYYLQANPDVAQAGADPLQHYLTWGWGEGRNPNPLFDTFWYLTAYPDIAQAGVEPLQHYLTWGWQEGRYPNVMFDGHYYLYSNLDVLAAGIEPLTHYMTWGWQEGRDPYWSFDTSYYLESYPDVAAAGLNPLTHFIEYGFKEGRTCIADTQAEWTLAQSPGAIRGHVDTFDPADKFVFVAPHDGIVSAQLGDMTADADLSLLDPYGTLIARSENGGAEPENLAAWISGGYIYSLLVEPFDGADTEYNLRYSTDFQDQFLFS